MCVFADARGVPVWCMSVSVSMSVSLNLLVLSRPIQNPPHLHTHTHTHTHTHSASQRRFTEFGNQALREQGATNLLPCQQFLLTSQHAGDSWSSAITRSLFHKNEEGITETNPGVALFFISYILIGMHSSSSPFSFFFFPPPPPPPPPPPLSLSLSLSPSPCLASSY